MDLARKYNSINYLLSGSFVDEIKAVNSYAGTRLLLKTISRYRNELQARRVFDFFNNQNDVSMLIGKAFQNFERVFSANDKVILINDVNTDLLEKINYTINEFTNRTLQEYKQSNTLYVLIVPTEKNYELFYLPVDDNFSIQYNENKEIVSYKYEKILVTKEKTVIDGVEYPNKTDYFPITKLINKCVKPDVSWSPLFDYFGSLEQLLLDVISFYYQKERDSHPPILRLKTSCNYVDPVTNTACKGGIITNYDDNGNRIDKVCPNCGSGLGAGQEFTVESAVLGEVPNVQNAYQQVKFDISALEFNYEFIKTQIKEIYESITGLRYNLPENANYQNITSIVSDYEKAKTVLNVMSEEFTRCLLFFVKYIFDSNNKTFSGVINLGTDFYLKTKNDYILELENANKSNLPAFLKQKTVQKISEMDLITNEEAQEFAIWQILEPYANYSVESVQNIADKKELKLKANFSQYIELLKLEIGVMNLYDYIKDAPLKSKKMKELKDKLYQLVEVEEEETEVEENETSNNQNNIENETGKDK